MTLRAGRTIMDAAAKKGVVLQVAENYRRSPEERAINWAIKQGRIGKLRMLYWIDVGERLWHWGWRDEVEQAGGGWSMDGGVHFADLFRYHIGEVDELYAVSKAYCPTRYQKHETLEGPIPATIEDTTVAVLHFENGVTGQWTSTNAAPGFGFSSRIIYGDEGSICWREGLKTRGEALTKGDLVQEFIGAISAEEKEKLFPRGVTDTVATELKEFIDAVATGSPVEITGLEGYKDEAISLALYESSSLNAPVKMEQVENLEVENYQSRFNKMIGLV
jgi:predicted dehydrogenase